MHSLRLLRTTALAAIVGVVASGAAFALQKLIAIFTNGLWLGAASTAPHDAFDTHWPKLAIVAIPAAGGLVVGLMARYGSPRIRGDGIPEVMESVLVGESRIAPRVALLKPLSAAISIGSGSPFGAEGPIIATGGALGSVLGQLVPVTEVERKTLLAAGAAAGMSAMFGSPVAAVILAVELLLFEMRARSLIPVAVASILAFITSKLYTPEGALFPVAAMTAGVRPLALLVCVALGLVAGLTAIVVTKTIYAIEDAFEKLPIHWMWWPALGGLAVGVIGCVEPRALGVGYGNIGEALRGSMTLSLCASIAFWKLAAWSISLGTGASGGILAPVLTVGAALGAALGIVLDRFAPAISPGVTVSAIAVMAATFAGTARAPIATVVLALELTHRVEAMPAVLAAIAAGQLVTVSFLEHSIMTERLARRGIPIGHEYSHDALALIRVREVMTREVISVPSGLPLADLVRWFAPEGLRTKHGAYPVVDAEGRLVGVVSRKDVDAAPATARCARDLCASEPIVCHEDEVVEVAKDRLAAASIGRLIVVERADPRRIAGIVSRSDVIEALARHRTHAATRTLALGPVPSSELSAKAPAGSPR
jgi:H+/Cl- antiporter ClcA/predicted transcriptional regulator